MAKHSTIYPSSQELEAVQTLVSTVECALKHVSDWLDQSSSNTQNQFDSQPEDSTEEDDPGVVEPSEAAEEAAEGYRSAYLENRGKGGGGAHCFCLILAKQILVLDIKEF